MDDGPSGSCDANAEPSSVLHTKSDRSGIFRAGKSGMNEELVYSPQGKDQFFFPIGLFPGGNELLAAAWRGDSPNARLLGINLASHEAVELGEVAANTGLGDTT